MLFQAAFTSVVVVVVVVGNGGKVLVIGHRNVTLTCYNKAISHESNYV